MMLAIFDRPERELELVADGQVPRGWLLGGGGNMYFHSSTPESGLREDGSPGRVATPTATAEAEAKPTMGSAMLKFDFTRVMFGGTHFSFFSDLQVDDVPPPGSTFMCNRNPSIYLCF